MGFAQRKKVLGRYAEDAFDSWAASKGVAQVPWGIHDPPFDGVQYLSKQIRKAPDRLCEDKDNYIRNTYHNQINKHFFVECKGVGKEQTVKVKTGDIETLRDIQDFHRRPVVFFVYDSFHKRVSISHTLDDLHNLSAFMETDVFWDNKQEYYKFPTKEFTWEVL